MFDWLKKLVKKEDVLPYGSYEIVSEVKNPNSYKSIKDINDSIIDVIDEKGNIYKLVENREKKYWSGDEKEKEKKYNQEMDDLDEYVEIHKFDIPSFTKYVYFKSDYTHYYNIESNKIYEYTFNNILKLMNNFVDNLKEKMSFNEKFKMFMKDENRYHFYSDEFVKKYVIDNLFSDFKKYREYINSLFFRDIKKDVMLNIDSKKIDYINLLEYSNNINKYYHIVNFDGSHIDLNFIDIHTNFVGFVNMCGDNNSPSIYKYFQYTGYSPVLNDYFKIKFEKYKNEILKQDGSI
jgi:hypothetical protein